MKPVKLFFSLFLMAVIFQRCQENDLVDTYILDSDNSLVEWCGFTDQDTTTGAFKLTAKDIKAEKGRITSGTFTIPITTSADKDQNEEIQFGTMAPLNNTENLDTPLMPLIELRIREVALLSGIHPTAVRGANWWVRAEMTMLGQTHQISFPAKIKFIANDLEVEAKFSLDYTQWGMNSSNNIFKNHLLPIMDLHLKGKARMNNKVVI